MAQENPDDISPEERKVPSRFGPGMIVPIMLLAVLAGYLYLISSGPRHVDTDLFIAQLKAKNVEEVQFFGRQAIGKFHKAVPVRSVQPSGGKAAEKKTEPEEPAATGKEETAKSPSAKSADRDFQTTVPERFAE